jgi:hypothetical protein
MTGMTEAFAERMGEMEERVAEMLDRPVERTVERDPDGRPVRVVERKLRAVS